MPIYRLLQNSLLAPDEIRCLIQAFETALKMLGLTNRTDPITELVAREVIELAGDGERNPERIAALAVEKISR